MRNSKMRKFLIAGNWKMNNDAKATMQYAKSFKIKGLERYDVDILLCPPFLSIPVLKDILRDSPVQIGAQNMHQEPKGAYTGEISADMILSAGCSYVLIGHSERRQYFGESDSSVNLKTHRALQAGLKALVCIGESLGERQADITFNIIETQLTDGLANISTEQLKDLVIAYEPVWAIGTGMTATPDQAQEVHAFIRSKIRTMHGDAAADKIRILYGGSANIGNANELLRQDDIDGLLIGGASLKVDEFTDIIETAHNL